MPFLGHDCAVQDNKKDKHGKERLETDSSLESFILSCELGEKGDEVDGNEDGATGGCGLSDEDEENE